MASTRPTIKILSEKLIRVIFTTEVAVTYSLLNATNYSISPITIGAAEVNVFKVVGQAYATMQSVIYVDLVLSKPTLDALYELNISGIKTSTGTDLIDQTGIFKASKTKVDSLLSSIPSTYMKDFQNGLLAQLFLAVALEDERVGGQGNLGPLAEVVITSAGNWSDTDWSREDW